MRIEKPSFADNNLNQAIAIANEMLEGKRGFQHEVRQITAFSMSKINPATKKPFTGAEIVDLLSQKIDVTVQKYKPWYIWSKATAYTDPGVPIIHLNARNLNRSVASIVNTLIHESVHVIDKNLCFAHGSNVAKGKDDTAPYKIGEIAEKLADSSPAIKS